MDNEIIINKGHSVLVLRKANNLDGTERNIFLNLFDTRGLSLMTLQKRDIKKIREFIGDEKEELCVTCGEKPAINSFYKECMDCILKYEREKEIRKELIKDETD